MFYWGIPFINTMLAAFALDIPSSMFGMFDLADVTVQYFDHYIGLGITPTFKSPSGFSLSLPKGKHHSHSKEEENINVFLQ